MKRLKKVASEELLNQCIEELRNTTDKNFFEQKLEKLLAILIEDQNLVFAIEENALVNMYLQDICFLEYLKQDILQIIYDFLVENNIDISLYDEEVFADSDIFKDVIKTTANTMIELVENILEQKLRSYRTASPSSQALQGVVSEGRKILQMLENMKFKIEQSARISANDQQLTQKIMQNSDLVDKIMSGLYNVCFTLGNLDISPVFDSSQVNISDDAKPDSDREKFQLEQPQENTEDEEQIDEPEETEESKPEEPTDENAESSEEENEESEPEPEEPEESEEK